MYKEKLKYIPHKPGSYQYLDKSGRIIYIGKAKDLNKRIHSYFNRPQVGKTAILVGEIYDFTYTVTDTENEAFLLEINLIKKYNPKYNILLKDDKTYPYIEYISKPFPKVKVSRYTNIKKKDKKQVFGPFPNAYAARRIVKLINRLYPLKKCDNMPKNVCLYYHIGECLGYCQKNIDSLALNNMENEIISFLKGNTDIIKKKIKERINYYSESLNYEAALELKNEMQYIDVILNKQKVEIHDYVDRDVWGYTISEGLVAVQVLFVRNGKLVGGNNNVFYIMSDIEDDIASYILTFYEDHEHPKEIICANDINNQVLEDLLGIPFHIVHRGVKKDLVKLAEKNAKIVIDNEIKNLLSTEEKSLGANNRLAKILNMPAIHRIDAFDNSNLFGSFSVSGMVVYINGLPAKKEYRKYKIMQDKNDDYNMMKEVIYRRYYRVLLEKLECPDLILVDGGVNQINACKEVLQALKLNIKVCGLKKNEKHRTNALIDGETYNEISLENTDNVFHYLTRIQDEVHRYTINYHKQIRSKGTISSLLDNIDGIGPKRKKKIIKAYGSLKNLAGADTNELAKIIPYKSAVELKEFLAGKGYI